MASWYRQLRLAEALVLCGLLCGLERVLHRALRPCRRNEQRHDRAAHGLTAADGAELLAGLALDVDAVGGRLEQAGETAAHGVAVIDKLRCLGFDNDVHGQDAEFRVFEFLHGYGAELRRCTVLVFAGFIREQRAEVFESSGAEHCVACCMQDQVAVAVPDWASITGDQKPGEPASSSRFGAVEVGAKTDAQGLDQRSSSVMMCSARARSSAVVILKLRGEPSTTLTGRPACSQRDTSSVPEKLSRRAMVMAFSS